MKKSIMAMLAVGGFGIVMMTAMAAQPDEKKGPKKGPPGEKKAWEPGKIIPPFVREGLELTEDQEKKIADLEKDVRDKLLKILTKEQLDRVKDLGPKGPPEKGKGKGKDKDKGKDPPPSPVHGSEAYSGMQWSGPCEAIVTSRPIMLVSAK